MKMRSLQICTAICLLLFAFGCGKETQPSDPTGGGISTAATQLDLTADQYTLNTNGTDSTTLTIVTRNASNAAIADVVVNLSASAGVLSTSQVTTDATGTATAIFYSGPEKSNQVVTITASAGTLTKTLPITLVGTTLSLTSAKSSLLAGAGDSTTLTVKASDSTNQPIAGQVVTLTSTMGNTLTAGTTSAPSVTVTTNVNGTATATLTALATPGTDTITASALGASTSLAINITNAAFSFTSPAENSTLPVSTSTNLQVTWTDATGAPVTGQTVNFTASAGTFAGSLPAGSAVTDGAGVATISYTASGTATAADIVASSGSESATLHLLIVATDPSQLSLQASPTVLGPSIGGVTASSTITATVRNPSGQLVANETVVFNLISGPGGGEGLSPGTAVTDAGGKASVTFTSGSAVSAQNGVKIRATLLSNPAIYADTTLTIAQSAASIILGSTNKISLVSVGGLEIGYALPFSILVVDINGNPIKDATVSLGLYPLYFYTGLSDLLWTGKYKNEDVNRNGILDPGEDGARGWSDPFAATTDPIDEIWVNGSEGIVATLASSAAWTPTSVANGILDPLGVASIPATVVTDADGLAAFQVKYPKSYGNWISVEIKASTQVSGSQSTAKIETFLDVLEGDTPFSPSPFGYTVIP